MIILFHCMSLFGFVAILLQYLSSFRFNKQKAIINGAWTDCLVYAPLICFWQPCLILKIINQTFLLYDQLKCCYSFIEEGFVQIKTESLKRKKMKKKMKKAFKNILTSLLIFTFLLMAIPVGAISNDANSIEVCNGRFTFNLSL